MHVDADDVVVTQGTQQALDLVARVLLSPGDVVAVEDPGYRVAADLFASHGARVVPVPVDGEGIVVDRIPAGARLVYTTPSHQFPLGVTLSLGRRRQLLAHAARHGAAVVEDDYDSEFRHEPRPLDTLHCLDPTGHVIYVGTFSKSLLPSLRLGYLLCPPSLRPAVLAARQLTDGYGPPHLQAALARFIDEGLLARHVRRATRVYTERRALVLEELARLPVAVVPSAAGLHVAAHLTDDAVAAAAVVAAAAREGVELEALQPLGPGIREGLVLGFGATVTGSVRPGIRRLGRLLAGAGGSPTTPGPRRRSPASR
ncbi:PLP-dependent aminotransferase family protein [Nocardioides sp. TF02-7]|uniref:aminotransferase-like domain-containing protein n=1 Tax=Nocardioides sp. TF02-7 TaxID=2917724 RepID=UPI001F066D0F|nr:PLP-dependent aminotransferase family protein [Nocardioides sp. TF02-7]UMG91434.1 PLP-dependent aminotransferase family protein [Nocardioides sp. TF02-7]